MKSRTSRALRFSRGNFHVFTFLRRNEMSKRINDVESNYRRDYRSVFLPLGYKKYVQVKGVINRCNKCSRRYSTFQEFYYKFPSLCNVS